MFLLPWVVVRCHLTLPELALNLSMASRKERGRCDHQKNGLRKWLPLYRHALSSVFCWLSSFSLPLASSWRVIYCSQGKANLPANSMQTESQRHLRSPASWSPDGSHIHSLDGLRAVAVGIVVAAHFTKVTAIPGGFGVTIFFAISGFIITRLLLGELDRTGMLDLFAFYRRRVFRLFPAIVVAILAAAAVQDTIGKDWVSWDRALASLFFIQNYYGAGIDGFDGPLKHHWSLSVEEHFYLFFPIVLMFLSTLGWRRTLWGLIGLCFVSVCFRFGYALTLEPVIADDYAYRASECRIESILWGCILALAAHAERYRWIVVQVAKPSMFWVALTVILACFVIRDDIFRSTIRYTFQGAALAVIFAHILFAEQSNILRWVLNLPPVVWIGRLSFSIYLLHHTMNHVAAHFLPWGPHDWPTLLFAVALTMLTAWACYAMVEQPMIKLGKRGKVHRLPTTVNG